MTNPPPDTIAELQSRLDAIAGLRIIDIARPLGIEVPENLRQQKGFVGQLLESVLGADGGNHARPDFAKLAVELKTIPVDAQGKPLESTYVSVVPLTDKFLREWHNSVVYAKLKQVAWLPVESAKHMALPERRVGAGFIWRPDDQLMAELQADYEELMSLIICGEVETITADQGQWLQIRPKAANRKALTNAIGPDGQRIKTLPRGFYLRPALTRRLIKEQYYGASKTDPTVK